MKKTILILGTLLVGFYVRYNQAEPVNAIAAHGVAHATAHPAAHPATHAKLLIRLQPIQLLKANIQQPQLTIIIQKLPTLLTTRFQHGCMV